MPHYYFDIEDGKNWFRDEEGTELATTQEAYDEAVATLLEVAKSRLSKDRCFRLTAIVKNGDEVAFKTTLALTAA